MKAAREERLHSVLNRLTASFSSETMQDRRQWDNIFKVWGGEGGGGCQPRTLYLIKLSFKSEEKIETFQDKQKQRIFHEQNFPTRNNINGVLQVEMTLESNSNLHKKNKALPGQCYSVVESRPMHLEVTV